ncbi:hypothetical protein A3C09_04095 [Candidatus Uhrbacteria bacterium RIFCSPHIGHO2_02_FULL_47_44]|nr:MAG: hypothetical protein A2839_01860 [Candidatus Uhrbacteria bacterium RIFCSPHIGHO2_01_FULL_47_10]OGL71090.1 MAG: hypothetical protein A3C09_04095 [Candidatus Uhrbacteria bacterium RIFCSPHIGHO2_02_FULL_47_44]
MSSQARQRVLQGKIRLPARERKVPVNSFRLPLILVTIMFLGACETAQIDVLGDQSEDSGVTTSADATSGADTATQTDATQADVPVEVTKTVFGDLDGDGFSPALGNDCDETDANSNKFAKEICDGKDNDCDGETDEGVLVYFHPDADKDGFGDNTKFGTVCIGEKIPAGSVEKAGDCNDSANDANGDGKVDGYWINQAATETCDDGIDNNCNGNTDEGCVVIPKDLKTGDNFALSVIWPSDKAGQQIMAVPYYAQADVGNAWVWFQESINSIIFTLVPDGNACGVRFNTAHGKPKATEWLCMDDKINPDAVILVIKADGSILDVTTQVKKWSAPEGDCSVKLELHDCK